MADIPGLILTVSVWAWFLGAGVMVIYVRAVNRTPAGLVPQIRSERLMGRVWVPVLVAWNVLPCLALTLRRPPFTVPAGALLLPGLSTLRWAASICAGACLCMTVGCWRRMGRNWRIGIVPTQRTELVTDGLYARIRHPIYAFNGLLMICSVVTVPTVPMLTVGMLHIGLILLKVRNEERFLLGVHGQYYADYRRRTGRFLPRLASRDF